MKQERSKPDASAASLCLFALALLPRLIGLADFFTTDEAYHWIDRTERFAAAVRAGRWADTLLTGHPGVTTMWLGSVGLWLEAAFAASPSAIQHLAWLRAPHATLEAALVAVAYLVARPRLGARPALLGCILWAASPFLIAHARLLHLDALLASFVTISLLLLLPPADAQATTLVHRRALLLSAVFAGLALLTKGPALILLPCAGLTLFAAALRGRGVAGALGASLAAYAVWLAVALLVVFALWPALWAAPGAAIQRYIGEIVGNGGRPNGDGQFFFGSAAADPGPLFYLATNLFRSTPLMLIGLALAAAAGLSALAGRSEDRRTHLMAGALLSFVLLWTLVMTAGPKKFDRYVLPTWPALCLLAGWGWGWLLRLLERAGRSSARARHRAALLPIILALAELGQTLTYGPYYLSYYNPLLGGGRAAQDRLLIGWGEGMDQVGAYLRSRPDIGHGPVLAALGATLQPFVPVDVRDVSDYGATPANYAVVYLESVQRQADPALYARLSATVPLTTIRIHGIEYATIYQLPRQHATPLPARFGEAIWLWGYTLERSSAQLVLTPAWDVRSAPQADYHLFVHLLDARGNKLAQTDIAPGGGDAPPTSQWHPGQQIAVPIPLALPPLAPGRYTLVMGLYDPATQRRLPLSGSPAVPAAIDGQDALLIETIVIP